MINRNAIRQAYSNGRTFKRYDSMRLWAPSAWREAFVTVYLDRVVHLMRGLLSVPITPTS